MWKLLLTLAFMAKAFFITCSEVKCNKSHEHYDSCAPPCSPQTCESIGKTIHCPIQPAVCKGSCRCDDGYYRNKIGECISEEDCKKCTGPHEYFSCGGACDNVCDTLSKQNQTHCPIVNIVCNPMCYCEKGYARDSNNICVPIDKCPKSCGGDPNAEPGCGINCGRLCSIYKDKDVICPEICLVDGCDCKKGFVYDENLQKCVWPKDCTPTCGRNEVYDTCANGGCRRWNCSHGGILCIDPLKCKDGCVCRDNYSRDSHGTCIPEHQCAQSCGNNEVYSNCANGGCRRRTCFESVICVHPKKCRGGYICRNGYTRAENGTCIPENQCPGQCHRSHEYYDDCAPTCPPQTCDSIGLKYNCPIQPAVCRGACRCENGYYRDKHGECIPKKNCNSCGGDPNAVPGCGINCGRLCSNYNKGPVPCPRICRVDGCDCKEGFVLDENIKKCVLPEKCSQTTKYHQHYRSSRSKSKVNKTDAKARLNKGSIALSGEFLYQLTQIRPNDNFVTSATSILTLLAQLTLFAKDIALEQLLTVLNLKNKKEIRSIFPDETANYRNQRLVEFEIGTKCYANKDYPLSKKFKKDFHTYFDASGENIDFCDNEEAANTINNWVSERTRGKIQNLVSADTLSADTVMVLVNAIYFFGNWTHQFHEKNTQKRDFTKRNQEVVQLDIMYQENNFNYVENRDKKLQALEMPYKGGNFSFLIILPEEDHFDDLVNRLRDPDELLDIINSMRYEKVKVYIPKMDISTDMDMAEMLQKDNVTEIFKPNADSFEGLLQNNKSVYVSAAVQKAMIKCNERGTKAAAATALTMTRSMVLMEQFCIFNANHAFLFYILYQRTPIFCGAFVGAPLCKEAL